MLSEWRSWEIGTANTAKRRAIVERGSERGDDLAWGRREGEKGDRNEDERFIPGLEDEGTEPTSRSFCL